MSQTNSTMPPLWPRVSTAFILDHSAPSDVNDDYAHYSPDATITQIAATRVIVRQTAPGSAFTLNGRAMPRLLLTRGRPYQFNVVTGTPFGFFDLNKKPLRAASRYTSFGFNANDTTPREFYYGALDNGAGKSILGRVKIL